MDSIVIFTPELGHLLIGRVCNYLKDSSGIGLDSPEIARHCRSRIECFLAETRRRSSPQSTGPHQLQLAHISVEQSSSRLK
jgi:hypothetical protein